MEKHNIAPHEGLDIHEILVFKSICMTKAFAMAPLAQDAELKKILNEDVLTSRRHVEQLRQYIQNVQLPEQH